MKDATIGIAEEWLDREAFPAMITRETGKINLTEVTEVITFVGPGREVSGEQYFR